MGLQPVIRRVWVDEWQQPTARVNWKREWLWLYSFVHPNSGETYWWLLPYVNTQLFNRVLKDFASHFGVGEHKRIVLVLDQAGWHISKELEVTRAGFIGYCSLPTLRSYNQPNDCGL